MDDSSPGLAGREVLMLSWNSPLPLASITIYAAGINNFE
jgi:hypothetical protein